MFRIDDPTAVASPPAVPAATGVTPGYFSNGSPGAGLAATIVPDWWLNSVQEEIIAVITQAGITPQKGTNNQLIAALRSLFAVTVTFGNLGWERKAGGTLLQWGNGVTTTGNQDYVAFPTSFLTNIYAIAVTEGNALGWTNTPTPTIYGGTRVANNGLSGFLVSACTIGRGGVPIYSASSGFNYIAVGS